MPYRRTRVRAPALVRAPVFVLTPLAGLSLGEQSRTMHAGARWALGSNASLVLQGGRFAMDEGGTDMALTRAWLCPGLVRALHKRPARARHRALYRHLLAAYGALQDQLGAASASLLEAVEAVLHQRHRASSAIEGFNAALRPYLYVHKGATQGFLDLFRAWFNLRTRRWGRHKGTSAHECLTPRWQVLIDFDGSLKGAHRARKLSDPGEMPVESLRGRRVKMTVSTKRPVDVWNPSENGVR